MVKTESNAFERTLTSGPVTLTIVIGDGQLGGSSLKLSRKPFGPAGDIVAVEIGSAAALRNRALEVRTLIADVNPQSNSASVTYEFTGAAPERETVRHRIKRDGGAVLFISRFLFRRARAGLGA